MSNYNFNAHLFIKKRLKKAAAVGLAIAMTLGGGYSVFAEEENIQLEAVSDIKGEGTKASPYLITEEGHLVAMANGDFSLSAYYRLENDIKLRSYVWKPIGEGSYYDFSGTFDGNGHTISNLKGSSGLFDSNSGTIKNLILEIAGINANGTIGGLVNDNSGTVDNCWVSGNITAADGTIGGIVGSGLGKITNSYSDVSISGEAEYVGGIVGKLHDSVENCGFYGSITDLKVSSAGGIIGRIYEDMGNANANIKNCYNNSKIDITGNVGGILGSCESNSFFTMQQCYNKSDITNKSDSSDSYTGGLIGIVERINSECYIKNCYSTGNINSSSSCTGGLIGYCGYINDNFGFFINNCFIKGNIKGNTDDGSTGGIIGNCYYKITLEDCMFIGKVTSYDPKAIIGQRGSSADCKNVFYDKSISGADDDNKYNVGLTSAEMKDKESYLFWDFDTMWDINENYNDGYPYLRALGINTSGVEINKTSLTMIEGNTYALNAVVLPSNSNNKNVMWKSSDKSVVTVDNNGVLTAVGAGTAKVFVVTVDGGYTAECNVTVKGKNYEETTVTLKAGNAVGVPGKSVKIPVTVKNNAAGISSFGINIVYDNKYLTPAEVTDGEILKDNIANLKYNDNTIRVTNAGASNKTGDGVLFYITFNVKGNINDINAQIEVKVDQLKTIQGNNTTDVEYFAEDGYVQVKNIILGDVDGDGEVTANDATQVLFKYAGFDVEW